MKLVGYAIGTVLGVAALLGALGILGHAIRFALAAWS